MNEQGYEQQVERLERKHATAIASIASAAVPREGDVEDATRDDAIDAVETALFNDEEWAPVKATDISDIAHEAVDRAIAAR
jgi:hypothetical protein